MGKKKRLGHTHHVHHHRHPNHDYADTSGIWFALLLFGIAAIVILFVFVPWNPYPPPPPPPPPVKEEFEASSAQSMGTSDPFVFRKKRVAEKRVDHSRCKTGEIWSHEDNMCAPIFNTPSSFEGSIMNITMNMCDDFFNSMCGRWNAEHGSPVQPAG